MYIFLIINFFLEMFFGRLFSYQNINALFFLVSLILIYPILTNSKKQYFYILFISGFIYDIVITNIISINSLLFLLIGYINTLYVQNFNDKFINNFVFLNLILILYKALLYIFMIMVEISNFNILNFACNLLITLLINSIYYIFISIFIRKIKR